MKTRTRLTTPPDEEPAPPPSAPIGSQPDDEEHYVPGFALPTEPRVPSRYRRALIVVSVLVVLAGIGYAALQVVTAGEDFDPAVGQNPGQQQTQLPDGGEGADG